MNSPLNNSDSDSVALFCVFSSYINTLLLRKNYTKTRNLCVFCLHINICSSVFGNYSIDYCYLFGSYAKGKATEVSDVDLLISTSITGMQFYDLVENIREALHKKVDVLNREQLNANPELIDEILKDGIKIYG